MSVTTNIQAIRHTLPQGVRLICVSKFQSEQAIIEAYHAGERDFGESRVQEMVLKHDHLPQDIHWHMIGHLQTNKVRPIIGFVDTIQSVDSRRLLETIDKEAARAGRRVKVLLEVHVAREESKSGMTEDELQDILSCLDCFSNVVVIGLMGMATNTDDEAEIRRCFRALHKLAQNDPRLNELSMGMSEDYPIAIEEGSTMVRVGSKIFGAR